MSVLMPLREFGLFMGLCWEPGCCNRFRWVTFLQKHDSCEAVFLLFWAKLLEAQILLDFGYGSMTTYNDIRHTTMTMIRGALDIKVMYPMALVARERWKFKKVLAQQAGPLQCAKMACFPKSTNSTNPPFVASFEVCQHRVCSSSHIPFHHIPTLRLTEERELEGNSAMTGVVVTQSLEHVEPHRCLMFKCSNGRFNGMGFSMQQCAVSFCKFSNGGSGCVSWQVPAQAHVVPIEAVFASDTTILEKLCKVHNMYIHSVVFGGSSSP